MFDRAVSLKFLDLFCYGLDQRCLLAVHKVHDVPLGGVGVAIFEFEDLVYAIVLERRKLDKEAQQACQVPPDDQVLLSPNLR